MNARVTFSHLLRLGCGSLLVAMAAVWGPYAQLLRVSVANERGNDVLVVAADLERGDQPQRHTKTGKHTQAVSAEGETPAAPRVLKPVLDDADLSSPHTTFSEAALPGLGYRFGFTDSDPPETPHAIGALRYDAALCPSGPTRAPPAV